MLDLIVTILIEYIFLLPVALMTGKSPKLEHITAKHYAMSALFWGLIGLIAYFIFR